VKDCGSVAAMEGANCRFAHSTAWEKGKQRGIRQYLFNRGDMYTKTDGPMTKRFAEEGKNEDKDVRISF